MEHTSDASYAPPHLLIGLGHIMTPVEARRALNERGVHHFRGDHIIANLRQTAITIYNHQKLAARYRSRTQDGADTLAYFICAAYGRRPPLHNEILPTSVHRGNEPFNLCHWDSLYYALLAEIRTLYDDVQQHFQTQLANGAFVLHTHGWDGTFPNSPFTALNMASQLEEMWLLLMDASLLGPLDDAVRTEQCAQRLQKDSDQGQCRTRFDKTWSEMSLAQKSQALDEVEGMIDTHSMSPTEILEMLWQRQIPLVRRACFENFQKDIQFKVQLATYSMQSTIEDIPPDQLEDASCTCGMDCQCHLVCQFEVSGCVCKESRNEIRRSVHWQEMLQEETQAHLEQPQMRRALGATTNSMAQLQIATMANPTPGMTQAVHTMNETAYHSAQAAHHQLQRDRSNTNKSELAYVPAPKTPGRGKGKKEVFPLAFYGDSPGGRYPQFRPDATTHSPPIYGASCYSTDVPPRRPVPDPLSTATEVVTMSSSFGTSSPLSPRDQSSDCSPTSKIGHSSDPESEIKKPFTQSFPLVAAGSPREPENEFEGWATAGPPSPYILTKSSSASSAQPSTEHHLPLMRHSMDSPQPRFAQFKPRIPPLDEPLSTAEEDLPDFIAPRPALKQRYVSAGGTAKLKDRAVIQDFILPASMTQGLAMSKEELLQKLREQQGDLPKRDSAVVISRTSQHVGLDAVKSPRDSREFEEMRGEKRVRTGSTSTVRKLKRVFSRQNSQSE